MNGDLPQWAMEPRILGTYRFPGLPLPPPGMEEVWCDLEYELQGLLLRFRGRLGREGLTGSVRAIADQADIAAITTLLALAQELR